MDINFLTKVLSKENLSLLANILSVVGFVLTLIVFINVRKIKSHYIFKGRMPELHEKLDRHASAILSLYQRYEDSREQIVIELKSSEVTLKSIRQKAKDNRTIKQSVKRVLKLMSDYNTQILFHQNKDALFGIFVEMRKVVDEIENHRKDIEWEK
jgi:hypothetical protein